MDIAPELLQTIQEAFETRYGTDKQIGQLIQRVADGVATYKEVEEYAVRCGEFLAEAFQENLMSDILPDGRMYFNIADRVIRPPMEHNHELVADFAAQVQQSLNEAAGIRIRPQRPDLDTDRIDGIINRVSSEPDFDSIRWILGDPVVNFTQNVADESIRKNADFHARSGFEPKITRTAEGKACKWCQEVAGTYDYADTKGKGNDVWRRHENCRCLIEYIPRKGDRQRVYNYRESNTPEGRAELERRRQLQEPGQRRVRIPQIPASTITEKVRSGEYSLKLSQQQYDKHVKGTRDYERYLKSRQNRGLSSQGVLSITKEEAQEIIYKQSGTGIIKVRKDGSPTNIEWITCDRIIGEYCQKGVFYPTNKAAIHHGKDGSHLVPQKGSRYD